MKRTPIILGLAAVTLAMGDTGCRFGNRVERPQSPFSETAYRTEISEARACVAIAGEADPRCTDLDISLAPNLFKDVLKSPVWLWNDSSQGVWLLYQKGNTSNYLQIDYDAATDELGFKGASTPSPLWEIDTDPCLEKLELIETGKIVRDGEETINGVVTAGSLDLNASWYRLYEGKCEKSLQEAADCLQSVSACQQTSLELNQRAQQAMTYRFAAFLESGLIKYSEIKDLEGLAIWVHSK